MRAEIIQIGNSKGLRIPKAILEQCEIKDSVDLSVEDHTLIVKPYKGVRAGWEKSFQLMAEKGDDVLLDEEEFSSVWDEEEWQW